MMRGSRTVGRLRAVAAFILLLGIAGSASVPNVVRAQEPGAQIEVGSVQATDGGVVVTIVAPAGLAGSPTASVDGAARPAEVTPARRPAVVLALETSSSMTVEQFAAARQAAGAFLGQLPPGTEVAIVTFDNRVHATGFADAGAAQAALEHLLPGGASALFEAVSTAAASLGAVERASATLVVVTHGWDWGNVSAASRADSYAAVYALGAEVHPVIVGSDFDFSLLAGLANPSRTSTWSLDDLGSGRLAAAVTAGARVEQQLRFATAGLPAGDHEVSIGWTGPTPVTAVVRTFPVVAAAASAPAPAAGEAVIASPVPSAEEASPQGSSLLGAVVVALLLGASGWFAWPRRKVVTSKVTKWFTWQPEAPTVAPQATVVRVAVAVTPAALAQGAPAAVIGAHPAVSRPNPAEQRSFERVELGGRAELSLSGVDASGPQAVVAFDISEGGLSFRTRTRITSGAHGYLSMALPPDGDEVQLHVLILKVVPVDADLFSAHCSFIDITPRTLWRIVGACLALTGDTVNAEELMNWGERHALTADQLRADPLFEPAAGGVAVADGPRAAHVTDEGAADHHDNGSSGEGAEVSTMTASASDERGLGAAMQLAWLLGEAAETNVTATVDSPKTAEVAAALDDAGRDRDGVTFGDTGGCSYCADGVLELQRLVRQDEFMESWWLCMACSRITYRQQSSEAWLRTTSVPDGLSPTGDPRSVTLATDFDAMVLHMRQEEATAMARAAQLRDELARTEAVLHDIRTLNRLLARFAGESPAA